MVVYLKEPLDFYNIINVGATPTDRLFPLRIHLCSVFLASMVRVAIGTTRKRLKDNGGAAKSRIDRRKKEVALLLFRGEEDRKRCEAMAERDDGNGRTKLRSWHSGELKRNREFKRK